MVFFFTEVQMRLSVAGRDQTFFAQTAWESQIFPRYQNKGHEEEMKFPDVFVLQEPCSTTTTGRLHSTSKFGGGSAWKSSSGQRYVLGFCTINRGKA